MYNIPFKIQVDKKYLQINLENLNLMAYQIEMVNQNKDINALYMEKINFNNNNMLNYSIEDLIPLEEYFQNNQLDKQTTLNIILKIGESILKAEEYFLNKENFLLEAKYVYISKNGREIKLTYIPVSEKITEKVDSLYKELVKKIIVDMVVLEEKYLSDNFMQVILNNTKIKGLNLIDFIKKIRELSMNVVDVKITSKNEKELEKISKSTEVRLEKRKLNIEEKPQMAIATLEQTELKNIEYPKNESKNLNNNINRNNQYSNINMQNNKVSKNLEQKEYNSLGTGENNNSLNEEDRAGEEIIKEIFPLWRKIVFIVLQPLFLGIAIFSVFLDLDVKTKAVGIAVCLLVDFLIFRILLNKDAKIKVKVKSKGNMKKSVKEKNKGKSNFGTNKGLGKKGKENNAPSVNLTKAEFVGQGSYDTEILDDTMPYLVFSNGGIQERIYVDKNNFRIGRLAQNCDYAISNKTIGKVHMQITKRGEDYYLMDLNSRNGTFVNEQKIPANQEIILNNNDSIGISNVNMIFKLD